MATMEAIELTNVGAIKQASVPYLPDGGVVELRGPQGVGKSTALEAIEAAATGKGKPPLRDTATKGEVKAFGVTLKLGARTTRSGVPEVASLEGRLSVADIVDPGIQDPAAADAKRIKALVQLAGTEPDPAVFATLFGGDKELMDAVVRTLDDETDLVVMAERFKRDCEKAARDEERLAEHAGGQTTALKQAVEGIDLDAECDAQKLSAELEAAIRAESKLKAEAEAAARLIEQRVEAERAIQDAGANSELPTMADALGARDLCSSAVTKAEKVVDDLTKKLASAKFELQEAERKLSYTEHIIKSVKEFDQAMDAWQAVIDRNAAVELIDDAALSSAADRVSAARAAMEIGVSVRKAKANLVNASEAAERQQKHARAAATLRKVAQSTDSILSAEVAKLGTPLRVEDGRLLVDTKRGPTFFGELSDGERWKLALDIAIDAVGEHGLIVIPQWAWGELQPANKRAIAERLRERHVLAYTAVATDGDELEARIYE